MNSRLRNLTLLTILIYSVLLVYGCFLLEEFFRGLVYRGQIQQNVFAKLIITKVVCPLLGSISLIFGTALLIGEKKYGKNLTTLSLAYLSIFWMFQLSGNPAYWLNVLIGGIALLFLYIIFKYF